MNVPQRQPQRVRDADLRIDLGPLSRAEATKTARQLNTLREFVRAESNALAKAADTIDQAAVAAARMTADCRGSVIVTGVGKAGLVGQKLVATLASTGSTAHFLHPCEAVHGDLGRVGDADLVWAISNSGRSEELTRIVEPLRRQASGLISFTASEDNPLAQEADLAVTFGKHREVDPNGLAPTASTAVMMAVGDAVAMLASTIRRFTPIDFAKYHPGGSLGRKLSTAVDLMRPLSECRIATSHATIRQSMITAGTHGRRSGAVLIVDDRGRLKGIFTDSDLARLFQTRQERSLDDSIADHMTAPCRRVRDTADYESVMRQLTEKRLSELPVVDAEETLLGMIDITDLVTMPSPTSHGPASDKPGSDNPASDNPTSKPRLSVVSPDVGEEPESIGEGFDTSDPRNTDGGSDSL